VAADVQVRLALRYGLRSVRVQYSTNGGHTWRTTSVAARSGYWVVTVPTAGSAISLRWSSHIRGADGADFVDQFAAVPGTRSTWAVGLFKSGGRDLPAILVDGPLPR
jgi:hypothetical protein